jgi:Flp pilus assembly protein TadD
MSWTTNWSLYVVSAVFAMATLTGCGDRSWFRPKQEQANAAFARTARPETKTKTKQKPDDFLDDLKPGFAEQMAKARTAESADRLEQAREIYQQLIREFPDRWEPFHRLGIVADRQRRHREARALYEQALILKPLDAQILNDLGYCFYLQGQLDKAESALAKAVAIQPSESRFRNNYGLVLGHQGRLEEALESFRRAGSEADAQYNLAFILATNDNIEAAKKCFRRALVADPNFTQAREALESFERYDRLPDDVRDEIRLADDGREWVPYLEGASHAGSQSQLGSSASGALSALYAAQAESVAGAASP